MTTSDTALVKWLAEHLRYQSVPEFISRQVSIDSIATIDVDLRSALKRDLPDDARYEPLPIDEVNDMLTQHGIIDVSYVVSADHLDQHNQSGIDLLGELGFLMDAAEERAFEVVSQMVGDKLDDATDMLLLKEEIEAGNTYLRLSLRATSPGTLPAVFTIQDACLANAQSVWLYRHPYW